MQKPFLKWVGGKTQILEKVLSKFPDTIENYYELFLGGGSVLLGVLSSNIKITGKIYAYDINKPLINLYKNIQRKPSKLYTEISEIINIYDTCPYIDDKFQSTCDKCQSTDDKSTTKINNKKPLCLEEALVSRESYYYWMRKQFNELSQKDKLSIKGSALFIILNKLCFRGVYREGPNGFNVPFGHYKKTPTIISEIHTISKLIENVVFKSGEFINTFKGASFGDFVYMDPPYVPVDEKSFVTYNKRGFNKKDHNNVFNITKLYEKKGIKFLLSNSNVPYVRNKYTTGKITMDEIVCRRTINSKNPGAKAKELLIYN